MGNNGVEPEEPILPGASAEEAERAAHRVPAANPAGPALPPRLPAAAPLRRRLRDQLQGLGHALAARGKQGLSCTRCRSHVTAPIRRHWKSDGP